MALTGNESTIEDKVQTYIDNVITRSKDKENLEELRGIDSNEFRKMIVEILELQRITIPSGVLTITGTTAAGVAFQGTNAQPIVLNDSID